MKTTRKSDPSSRVIRRGALHEELQRRRRELAAAGLPIPEHADEVIGVRADLSGAHQEEEAAVTDMTDERGRPVVIVARPNPFSALPDWYAALGVRHVALREFLEVFQAAAVALEDNARHVAEPWRTVSRHDSFASDILNLLGPEIGAAVAAGLLPSDVFVRNAGLFLDAPTPEGLELLLTDALGSPTWVESRGRKGRLRLHLGPLNADRFRAFRPPHGLLWSAIVQLTLLYVGDAPSFDVRLILRADDVPDCVPDSDEACPDWGCWLKDPVEPSPRDGALLLSTRYCRRSARKEENYVPVA
jgi:predicted component of type VI protein secretion system